MVYCRNVNKITKYQDYFNFDPIEDITAKITQRGSRKISLKNFLLKRRGGLRKSK